MPFCSCRTHVCCAVTLQWDKLKKAGTYPHAARWYDSCCELPSLLPVVEQYGLKRRTQVDMIKEKTAAGKGGGGVIPSCDSFAIPSCNYHHLLDAW